MGLTHILKGDPPLLQNLQGCAMVLKVWGMGFLRSIPLALT